MTEYPRNKEMAIIKSGLMSDDLAERRNERRCSFATGRRILYRRAVLLRAGTRYLIPTTR